MADLRGNLLIGGMTLKNVSGRFKEEPAQGENWGGELLIDQDQARFLETERPYRLELEDGRAGKIVITRFQSMPSQQNLQVTFKGLSSCEGKRLSPV